jgi:hypothetical protein
MRSRAKDLIDRMLNQLEEKPEALTMQDMGAVEKAVKTLEILAEAEARDGKKNPNAQISTEDLEDEFE